LVDQRADGGLGAGRALLAVPGLVEVVLGRPPGTALAPRQHDPVGAVRVLPDPVHGRWDEAWLQRSASVSAKATQ
jgi:hypothetical protein